MSKTRNYVAKFSEEFNKPKTHRSKKSDYKRKGKERWDSRRVELDTYYDEDYDYVLD